MDFKQRLTELLEDFEISAKQLSKVIDIDHSSLYEYLAGVLPNVDNAVRLANHFNCSLDYLFGLDTMQKAYKCTDQCHPEVFFPRYKDLLNIKKISHHKLCKDTGVNQSSFWLWSKGSIPKSDSLIKIAEYLNCSIDYLVGRTDQLV